MSVKEIFDLSPGGLSPEDKELIEKAYTFAEKAHLEQKRASGDPYFVHVFETAKILSKIGMDAKTITAGLLHDTLEDTKTTEKDVKENFGEDVLFLVKGVTKLGTLKYHGSERHVESLRKFFVAMANDLRVVIIKLADRLHNLRTLEYVREDKRRRIALESIEVYAALANRLGMGKLKGEIEDAAFPFLFPKEYAEVEELIKEKKESYQSELEKFHSELENLLKENKIKTSEITYRVKNKYSLWKKLQRYNMDIDKIYDIIAIRVVVKNIPDCYKTLGLVHSIWRPLPGRIKDYIAVPKPNGYQSIHTTVFTGTGAIIEIQIRTEEMHAEAAYGIAAHFAYKERGSVQIDKSKIEWIEGLKSLKNLEMDPKKFFDNLRTDFFNYRIFIFTPKGDVVDLPADSTPIDFAYMIHSDIGNHVSSAKVSGRMSPLDTKLKNGDIVEIITKKDAHPSSKWLNHVKTTAAKKNIKSYLEKNSLLTRLKNFGKN